MSEDLTVREKKEVQAEQGTRQGPWFEPTVDIWEDESSLTLVADVPGVAEEAIRIDLRDNVLTIEAETEPVEERWKPLYAEYRLGHYARRFRLGHVIDQGRISAAYKDGVLTVHLPKVERLQPRRIEVKAEG